MSGALAAASTPVIRAVVFDLDGLMFNTEHVFWHAGDELLRRRGLRMTTEIMNLMLGRRPHESFQRLTERLNLAESPDDLLAESRTIFHSLLETRLEPMPGLFDLLDRIARNGLPMGVATSSPRKYLMEILERYGLVDRFRQTLTSEDVLHGKPHPEIYLKSASMLNVSPAEMLVLEDTETGTRAAAAAGAHIISVPHEYTSGHDFSEAKAIANTLADPLIAALVERGGR